LQEALGQPLVDVVTHQVEKPELAARKIELPRQGEARFRAPPDESKIDDRQRPHAAQDSANAAGRRSHHFIFSTGSRVDVQRCELAGDLVQ
jgi:hypothetical protein